MNPIEEALIRRINNKNRRKDTEDEEEEEDQKSIKMDEGDDIIIDNSILSSNNLNLNKDEDEEFLINKNSKLLSTSTSSQLLFLEDNLELKKQKSVVREIGSQAVWSLSSCKPGFGVEQLRDNCKDTYWQSDGVQPHLVNIQFRQKTTISEIKLFIDYKMDESYTPNRISVRAGNHFHDIHEITLIELNEPNGWETILLRDSDDQPIRAFLIQIAILSNHQNGRDTHIRQIKINSPVEETYLKVLPIPEDFHTIKFWQHANLR